MVFHRERDHPDIIRVDIDDDASLQRYADLVAEMNVEVWGDEAQRRGIQEFRAMAREEGNTCELYLLLSPSGERAIGIIEVQLPLIDMLDDCVCHIRLLKSIRGYGYGRILVQFTEDITRARGRRYLVGHTSSSSMRDDRDVRFLRKQGFTEANHWVRMDIDLPLNPAALETPTRHPHGFSFSVAWDSIPEAWIPGITEVLNIGYKEISDDFLPVSEDFVRTFMSTGIEQGRRHLVAIAQDVETRVIVAMAEIYHPENDRFADQHDFYVRPEYRPLGIGRSLQARVLSELYQEMPWTPRARMILPDKASETIELFRSLGYRESLFMRRFSKEVS